VASQRSAQAEQITVYPTQRRIRGMLEGEAVVDSRDALLVWEPGARIPQYAFPGTDVGAGLLAPGSPPADAADRPASDWFSLQAHGRELSGAAWSYADPDLEGYVGFSWRALDRWLEEDEEIHGHPRDPFHRVDAIPSSRQVMVEIDGQVIADSRRPVLLFETGLPVRYYLPREDVRADLLRPSATHSFCPYKGVASYETVALADQVHEDAFWFYPEPLPAVAAIAGRLAPYNERVELLVDGERLPRST
jgi:uncharacterized protein (DUF427 family)